MHACIKDTVLNIRQETGIKASAQDAWKTFKKNEDKYACIDRFYNDGREDIVEWGSQYGNVQYMQYSTFRNKVSEYNKLSLE